MKVKAAPLTLVTFTTFDGGRFDNLLSSNDGTITTSLIDSVTLTGTPTPAGQWPAESEDRSLSGRLTRIEDRNGYAVVINYKQFTPAQLAVSPVLQLQYVSIIDPMGRKATFSYGSTQVSGLWAISRIDLPNGSNVQYTYDSGKLSSALLSDGSISTFTNGSDAVSQTTTVTYAYDALGRRVSKLVNGLMTVFVNDGVQEITEYENGALARSYVFGSYINEPLILISGGAKSYYHTNNLFSIAALTNSAGAVVERYTYDPYGGVTILAADGLTNRVASAIGNPWSFTGRRLDVETTEMYFRARYYDVF